MPSIALLDADALHKLYLRGILTWLASYRLYSPRWTEEILDETIQSISRRFPMNLTKIEAAIKVMASRFPDAKVTGYGQLAGTLGCLDPKDEHVLAAAIVARADLLVTFNLKDFPKNSKALHGVEAIHPDRFLMNLIEAAPDQFLEATSRWCAGYNQPALSIQEISNAMGQLGCPRFGLYLLEKASSIESHTKN